MSTENPSLKNVERALRCLEEGDESDAALATARRRLSAFIRATCPSDDYGKKEAPELDIRIAASHVTGRRTVAILVLRCLPLKGVLREPTPLDVVRIFEKALPDFAEHCKLDQLKQTEV